MQALSGCLVHMTRANGGHHGQAAHGVQPGADDAAVNPVETEVADQVPFHVDAPAHLGGFERCDLQSQHLVENNHFLKDFFKSVDEFIFELDRGWGCKVLGHALILTDQADGKPTLS